MTTEAAFSSADAVALAKSGEVRAALDACERAIEGAPDSAEGYLAKGRILRASGGDAGVALRALRRATECGATPNGRADALREYALALETIGRHRESAAALEEALALLPADAPASLRAGLADLSSLAHERAGDDARALERLREAAAPGVALSTERSADLLSREAGLLERLGRMGELFGCYARIVEVAPDCVLFAQPDEARPTAALFERLRRLLVAINAHLVENPGDGVARIVKAGFFFRLGRYRQAEQILAGVLGTGPGHFYAHHLIAKVRLKTGKPGQALDALEKARPLAPEYLDLERDRALALEACERSAEALDAYRRIEARWPGRRDILLRAGRLREELGLHEEAYEALARAAALSPAPEREAQERLAALAAKVGRAKEAAEHFGQALALLQPGGGAVRGLTLDRAAARAAAGDLEGALADATAVLAPEGAPRDGLHREALARRTALLVRLDRGDDALLASEELLTLEGEGDERALLLRGDALRAAHRFQESVKVYSMAADRKLAETLLESGAKLAREADFSKALGRFNESFRRNPQSWEVFYFAAAAYARLGQAAPAAKYLAAAARVNRGAVALMEQDRDFDAVRASPDVAALLAPGIAAAPGAAP